MRYGGCFNVFCTVVDGEILIFLAYICSLFEDLVQFCFVQIIRDHDKPVVRVTHMNKTNILSSLVAVL